MGLRMPSYIESVCHVKVVVRWPISRPGLGREPAEDNTSGELVLVLWGQGVPRRARGVCLVLISWGTLKDSALLDRRTYLECVLLHMLKIFKTCMIIFQNFLKVSKIFKKFSNILKLKTTIFLFILVPCHAPPMYNLNLKKFSLTIWPSPPMTIFDIFSIKFIIYYLFTIYEI